MTTIDLSEKFGPIRKGLLEFAVLRVIAGEKLYVAEMLQRLAGTEFATQEGTLYPAAEPHAPRGSWSTTNGRSPKPGRPASTTASPIRVAVHWKNCRATGTT